MTLNLEQIKEIIPHRDPFLLIDEVTELEPGVSVTAKKYLKPDEDWFRGHFPNQPVQPGFRAWLPPQQQRGSMGRSGWRKVLQRPR